MGNIQKAIVALVLAILEIIDWLWGTTMLSPSSAETIGVIIAILFPLLVWIVPNRSSV